MVLLAASADDVGPGDTAPDVNRDLLRLIGFGALTILCMVQWASPSAGRRLNVLWAIIKIIFVIVLIGFGGYAATHRADSAQRHGEWFEKHAEAEPENNWAKLSSASFSALRAGRTRRS